MLFSWDIGPQWQIEPAPDNTSDFEVLFFAENQHRPRLELEHCHIDRHGPGWQVVRDGIASDAGWTRYRSRYTLFTRST